MLSVKIRWRNSVRITKLNIYGFGCWVDTEFNFQTDYQVICGDNETGKTTILYFIRSILFGFASARGQEKYWQYLPRQSSKYGGEIELIDNDNNYWLVRRVKNKNNEELKIFKNNQETDPAEYAKLLGPVTDTLFAKTNFVDRKALEQVYHLSDDELLEQILAMGAVGSNEWLKLQKKLIKDADQIYRPRGKKYELNQLLEKADDLQQRLSQVNNENKQYQTLEAQLQKLNQQASEVQTQVQTAQKQLQYWQNLQKNWSNYVELQNLTANLTDSSEIDNQDWNKYIELKQQLALEQQNIGNLEQQRQNIQFSPEQTAQLNYFIAHQPKIEQLQQQQEELRFQQQHLEAEIVAQQKQLHEQQTQLLQQNPQLTAEAQPLTRQQIQEFQKLVNQTDAQVAGTQGLKKVVIGLIAVVVTVGGLVIGHSLLLALLGLLISLGGGWWLLTMSTTSSSNVQVRTKIQSFKQKYHLDNLTDQEVITLQGVIGQLANLTNQIQKNQSQIEQYQKNYQQWQQSVQLLLDNANKHSKPVTFSEFYQNGQHLLQLQQPQQNTLEQINPQITTLKLQQEQQQQQLNKILAKYHVTSLVDFEQLQKDTQHQQQKLQRQAVLQETLKPIIKALQTIGNQANLDNKLQQAQNKLQHQEQIFNQIQSQQAQLMAQENQLADDNQYQQVIQTIEYNNTAIATAFSEWISQVMAAEWINETLNQASANRFPKLMQQAEYFFQRLTNNHYRQIEFINNNLTVLSTANERFEVYELSRGTAAQLYLALTLAFSLEMADLTVLPILIDDAFVDFDPTRKANIGEIIQQMAKTTQIIYVCTDTQATTLFDQNHILNLKGL
ncbi:hypothetical protein DS832_02250 [Bombilactobacillus bombi]|uniref:YhaN AAA domain-containing protein n=1 Tax=Bombilactobacillus bombi TaxID=1303590 RepID=A0A3R6W7T8_9LACO|nr:hypothetical protein DS832_02250 [Bombilactobacillus bombi]